jgi:hypothetical protein
MATATLVFCTIVCFLISNVSAAVMRVPSGSIIATEELALSSRRDDAIKRSFILSGLHRRDEKDGSVCGGDSTLFQCGASFPSDFCCPSSTTCLQLDSSATAVLCCPAGLDCKFISPISCDEQAQNATMFPGNQFHSDPTTPLDKCGDSCCPVGATCHDGVCAVSVSTVTSTLPTSTIAAFSHQSTSASTAKSEETTSSASVPAATSHASIALDGVSITDGTTAVSSDAFSGKSFVAGLFPGIVIGALVVATLIWCVDRRRRRGYKNHLEGYPDPKHFSTADQLTSLSTGSHRTLPTHTRSISEPISDPYNGHRTDFVRGTPSPPRIVDPLNHNAENYIVTATGPITPARTPKIRALFSRSTIFQSPPSPQMSQLPSHMKRGTLSHAYTISPIRALRSKKSSHSLRRQMTASAAIPTTHTAQPWDQHRPRASTTGSTETIRVTMPHIELEACTPDQRTLRRPPVELGSNHAQGATRDSEVTWATVSSSPLYPEPIRVQQTIYQTPTRIPASQARTAGQPLGTQEASMWRDGQGLSAQADARRQTTFSGFMEKAGVRPGVT